MKQPKTALVLGGGGSKGALQAGFYRALSELGIKIDLVIAASVGALNGAFIAAGLPPRLVVHEWSRVRRRDILAVNWRLLRRGAVADSIYTFRNFRRFLEERLPVRTFEELSVPFIAVTTDLQTGRPYLWERGSLVDGILASCAIPGIFPPVTGPGGRRLIDGALTDNVPVSTALALGAERVVGILCPAGSERPGDARGITRLLGRAFGIATDLKWRLEGPRYEERPEILIIEPPNNLHIDSLDFSRGGELARAGYRTSRRVLSFWLEELADHSGNHRRRMAALTSDRL
jgi:NTE family protein